MSQDPKTEEKAEFPSAATLCLEWPLYASFALGSSITNKNALHYFLSQNAQLDCFCPYCGDRTVLLGGKVDLGVPNFNFSLTNTTYEKRFFCSRKHNHEFFFVFRVLNQTLIKIGQSPAKADLDQVELRRYKDVLPPDYFKELNRAGGLASHGIGIGSFVYLRRIFERLVDEAKEAMSKNAGWDEDAYSRARMDEKILLLKNVLPQFLVEQRSLYGILSKGIHSLSEEQCLAYFAVVQAGIELILDQKLAEAEQQRKLESARKNIAMIREAVKAV